MQTIQLHQAANAVRQFPGQTTATLADDGQAHCLAGRWYPGADPDHLPSDLLRGYSEVMAGLPSPVDPNQNELFA